MNQTNIPDMTEKTPSYKAIMRALFETYESIYAVDAQSSAYQCFYESDSFSSLCIESRGDDFFQALEDNVFKTVYPEDINYVRKMLSKEALLSGLQQGKYYSFVYRLMIDGKPLYHKLRATMGIVHRRRHFLIGIRNIDTAFRQDLEQARALSAMHSKEITHLEAILASAEGYLEANLSKDSILEISQSILSNLLSRDLMQHPQASGLEDTLSYSAFETCFAENQVLKNREKYLEISNREYLIKCFESGEKRASVSFSAKGEKGQIQPCKKVFYLYRDLASGDILSFCVIYDLTEQQRKEKELRELENELQKSRLRNFTSQMQPHFLYNALGSIQEIVLEDPEYASELLGDFTTHLRSCIRAMSNDAPIPFTQELKNIEAYINIEKMRFGERLKVVYDIKARDFSIIPLSVQPIVENAIRHGIYKRGKQGGTLSLRTAESKDAWTIVVEDNGVGFDVAEFQKALSLGNQDSTGLKNIMFRLDKMMHAPVEIKSVLGKGTQVTITIPKENYKNESDHS